MEDAKGFDVTEYGDGDEDDTVAKRAAILSVINDRERDNPTIGIKVTFMGDLMRLTYHSYEMGVPSNMKEVESRANKVLDEAAKFIKKEYKNKYNGHGKKKIDLKEQKPKRDYQIQKVSMNERYYVLFWRFYEIE